MGFTFTMTKSLLPWLFYMITRANFNQNVVKPNNLGFATQHYLRT